MSTTTGKFDLNMEEVLEAWHAPDAIREIIANGLDEQALTETDDIEIFEDDRGWWHVRDFGRGLRYEHFTQNEDDEKLENPHAVIGKSGVGLSISPIREVSLPPVDDFRIQKAQLFS